MPSYSGPSSETQSPWLSFTASSGRGYWGCADICWVREGAEDATSEVFIRLKRGIAGYNGSVPFLTWLYSIASHHCVDLIRRRQVEQRIIVEEDTETRPAAGGATSPLDEVMMAEQNAEVRRAIGLLPGKYRLPLVLRYYSDFSYDEIARQLGLQRAHVATLIFRGKQELRQTLAKKREMWTSR